MGRLGIIGGTFDPVHTGHVLLALFASEALCLDEVLFVPAADPPHKEARPDRAPAEARLAMVERAIAGLPGFRTSRLELERPGKSYTVDTLRQLRALHPLAELFLIVGADNIAQIPTWHDPEGILALCTLVAGARPGSAAEGDPELLRRIRRIDTPLIDISSTRIRQRLAAGLPIRYLVPEAVEIYIREKGLYTRP